MSKSVDNIYILHNNPFLLTPILVEFYKSYGSKQSHDILLSYLIFPLVLYSKSLDGLTRVHKQRTLRTFKKENERVYGLPERLNEYKHLTNICLQYAIDTGYIQIDQDMSITVQNKDIYPSPISRRFTLAAQNAARMLKEDSVVTVYRQLGIKRI